MSGAICGGSPYIWKVEAAPERWCFGERKRRAGRWELRGAYEQGSMPVLEDGSPDPILYWEPIWVYKCEGCDDDRRAFPGWEWGWNE